MHQLVPEHLPSKLEALPTELLEPILSASRSKADLHALVSASPVLYKAFLSTKRTVFVNILIRDLNPALRDALAVTTLVRAGLDIRIDGEKIARILQQYQALPRGVQGLASATMNTIVALLHINHSVQFLVDEFTASRLPALHKIQPNAARPLTLTERWRLAQALLWHQILTSITQGHEPPSGSTLLQDLLALFRPWQMHQLFEIHSFVCYTVNEAFFYCRETAQPAGYPMYSPHTELQKERHAAYCDLGILHRKIASERARLAANPGTATAERQRQKVEPEVGPSGGTYQHHVARFNFLRAGPLPRAYGSLEVAEIHRDERDDLYRREDAMPPLVHDENDASSPPFGWVDAHAGINCQRWGAHLRREVVLTGQDGFEIWQRRWAKQHHDQWCWSGFAFWDRRRVELLKTRMPVYETGWLTVAPPSEEECKIFYKAYDRALNENRVRPTRTRRHRASVA